jgi:3-phosphoshikimate 1-carboxyvinyltransferase
MRFKADEVRTSMERRIQPARRISGEVRVPGDKSISHRALMLSALARGESSIRNLATGADVRSTVRCLRALAVDIHWETGSPVVVRGVGLRGLRRSRVPLDVGNSGTTIRLLSGILAGQPFESVLTGDESLRRRPMGRIIEPLERMGARIESTEGHAPLQICGGSLRGIRYELPVPSAQVKSCLLLAGLYAEGETTVVESVATRDHTESLLAQMGAPLHRSGGEITIAGGGELDPFEMSVLGDLSSAAFLIAAAALLPGSELLIRAVGVNPMRTGFLDALQLMGARIERLGVRDAGGEPVADLLVRGAAGLRAIEVHDEMIPRLIDEVPLLAVIATQAEGTTVIRDAEELRVKETDRLRATAQNLRRMGVEVEERPDGLMIPGPQRLRGARVETFGDHRIAMAFSVAGLVADGVTVIAGAEWANVSFPGFFDALKYITVQR